MHTLTRLSVIFRLGSKTQIDCTSSQSIIGTMPSGRSRTRSPRRQVGPIGAGPAKGKGKGKGKGKSKSEPVPVPAPPPPPAPPATVTEPVAEPVAAPTEPVSTVAVAKQPTMPPTQRQVLLNLSDRIRALERDVAILLVRGRGQ